MANNTVDLNDKQVAVLRWIGQRCPDGVMEGYAHRVSASALRSRALVRISGRGKTWRAELTDEGSAVLASLSTETEPLLSTDEPPTATAGAKAQASAEASDDPAAQPHEPRTLSKTEQLVADVIAAGGTLTLPDETRNGGVNYRQRAYAAQRHGKVPEGKHLHVSWTHRGFEISLLDGATGNELGADEFHVPSRLRKYHCVAREYRDRTSLHEVSRKTLPRALRIVHALAGEIERRGHEIACVDVRRDSYGRSDWKASNDGQFVVTIDGHAYKLRLKEKGVGFRGPWEAHKQRREENRAAMRFDHWDVGRIEPYDKGATGQLDISILSYYGHRQGSWGDRKRWTLEERLPQLLRELETLAAEAEQRRLAREREEEERQRQWEQAMEHARVRLIDDHRIEVLRRRVSAWQEAEAIRAYCDAIEARHGANAIAADPEAARWLFLARQHADDTQALPRMPADPEVTPDALKPFLGGWSPHGPAVRRW